MGKFYSTKTYNNDRGLSCCFRQWKAKHSHCSLLHGYSIGVKLVFCCDSLDERNWVMDFGGLREFKCWLEQMFDHTTIVAYDDPMLEVFKELEKTGVISLRVVDAVGCERFAELCFNKMKLLLEDGCSLNSSVRIESVEVFEHSGNSAIYEEQGEKN